MARKIYRGYARDGNGTVLSGATVSVYLTGTSTVASIYAASSGGTAVNSTTTDSTGLYSFYVDYSDYAAGTQFRLTISKTGYDSVTYDEVECLPPTFSTDGTLTDNSDADFPSEKAVKTYVDARVSELEIGSAAFYAYLTNNATDVTGDGTLYNMVGAIWTEVYDTHDCFSNGIFTAPHDGLYRFDSYLEINGLTSSHTGLSIYAKIEPAAQYNSFVSLNPYAISESGHVSFPASCLRLLSALDKVSLQISVTGGAKVIGIYGKGIQYIPYSYFAGYRVA